MSLSIRLPKNLEKDLEIISKEEKISKSEIVRDALERYLSIKRFRQIRRQTLPFAESEGYLTDEDIFKSIS